jgi:hypothetical protein
MNAWFWAAVVCGLLTVGACLLPKYYDEETGQGVYSSQVGRGYNWLDENGNPIHDDLGRRIHPNPVKPIAVIGFAGLTVALATVGLIQARRKRERLRLKALQSEQ